MVTFRIYPEPGRTLYVRVNVHPTKKAMREYWRASNVRFNGGTWGRRLAYCTPWHVLMVKHGRCQRNACIAEVNLYRARLTMEIVTHELFHATMEWGRRVRFPFSRLGDDDQVNQQEERAAYAHGELCRQFMVRANAAGLYD